MNAARAWVERCLGPGPGPRVFRHRFAWLLLAAALPLALAALLTQIGAGDRQAQALATAREQASRALADSLFERLLAARELMQALAGEAQARGAMPLRASSVFVEFVRVPVPQDLPVRLQAAVLRADVVPLDPAPAAVPGSDAAGLDAPAPGVLRADDAAFDGASPGLGAAAVGTPGVGTSGAEPGAGEADIHAQELLRWWAGQPASAVPLPGRSRLLLRPARAEGDRADVLLASATADGVWLARLDPLYLWPVSHEARALPSCVRSTAGWPVACTPAAEALAGSAGATDAATRPAGATRLVLQPEFGTDDWWVFREVPGGDSAVVATRAGMLGTALALLAVTVAALAAFLQTRATVRPMSQLLDGARRLSQDDLAARVEVPRGSEWGELAQRFNTMAGELESRFDALRGLAAIDRAVIAGSGLESALTQVLAQLALLWPEAGVAVVLDLPGADGRSAATAPVMYRRRAGAAVAEPGLPLAAEVPLPLPSEGSPSGGQFGVGVAVPALLGAVAAPQAMAWCWWLPVRLREREVALLMAWAPGPPLAALAAHASGSRARELRDHVGLLLAAQERDALLLQRARQDALTGLLNRSGFDEALEAMSRRRGQPFGVLSIELLGPDRRRDPAVAALHDELLSAAAKRLREALPPGAIACRSEGAARFQVALAREPLPAPPFERSLQAVQDALGGAFELGGESIVPGVAVGIALHPEDGATRPELQARSLLALRAARRDGPGTRRRFDASLEAAALKAAGLRADLKEALETGAFELRWQPRVDARSGCAVSAEALLRWRHPQRGLLSATEFMAVASTSALAVPIGQWVLNTACRQLAAWRKSGIELERISVNVTLRQLQEPDFDEEVLTVLAVARLEASDLELEFGEAVLAQADAGLRARIARLRREGVRIALDDFGNGHASMSSLRELPVDAMKLDAALVQTMEGEPTSRAMVQAIAGLAGSLGLALVAEGIETDAMAERLRSLPCAELQGYAFSAPLDAAGFARLPCVCGGGDGGSGGGVPSRAGVALAAGPGAMAGRTSASG